MFSWITVCISPACKSTSKTHPLRRFFACAKGDCIKRTALCHSPEFAWDVPMCERNDNDDLTRRAYFPLIWRPSLQVLPPNAKLDFYGTVWSTGCCVLLISSCCGAFALSAGQFEYLTWQLDFQSQLIVIRLSSVLDPSPPGSPVWRFDAAKL